MQAPVVSFRCGDREPVVDDLRAGMAGDLLTQTKCYFRSHGADRWVLDRSRALDVDLPLADHPAGPGREQDDPLTQAHRFADVVRDEDDAVAGFFPDPG